jgi:aspartate-semialdehyde dehydrogenase
VVDNSSAFRGDPACGLVIPEVNAAELDRPFSIFAVPNCSTIQMVAALAPLHRAWGLRAVRVATYQSASGAGARAMEELERGARALLAGEEEHPEVFPHPIAFNLLPQIGSFDETGETQEERKMRDETRRLLELPDLPVSATCVRVPVMRGHSEAIWASFAVAPDPGAARDILREAGIVVEDDPGRGLYPLPRRAAGRPETFAGRIRRDPADPLGLCLWVVADNLLKGAAGNAFDIARALIARGRVGAAGASA